MPKSKIIHAPSSPADPEYTLCGRKTSPTMRVTNYYSEWVWNYTEAEKCAHCHRVAVSEKLIDS